jgi:hypothetical protein
VKIWSWVVIIFAMRLMADTGSGQISGPVLGYAKRGAALRAVLGVPGAAYFGAAVDLGGLELAAVSAQRGYAVALTPDHKEASLIPLSIGSVLPVTILANAPTGITAVRLSPSGNAAALVRDDVIDVVTGLPSQPVVKKQITKPADLGMIALSDDGQAIALVDRFGVGWLLNGDSSQQIPATDIRDIEFRSEAYELFYIDGDVVNVTSGAVSAVLAGPADGVSTPRRGGLSHNGQSFFVLNANSTDLLIGRNPSGVYARVSLPCQASELEWLHDMTLRLSCESTEAVHLLQVSEAGARVLFVPEPVE